MGIAEKACRGWGYLEGMRLFDTSKVDKGDWFENLQICIYNGNKMY